MTVKSKASVTVAPSARPIDERRAVIAARVRALPEEPGCYLMKDVNGAIFYIGKAIDLRSRVKQYFSGSDTRQFVQWLDEILYEIDVIVVRNDQEAILLERTLIAQHQPRYNVLLRDDKNFLHLRLLPMPAVASLGLPQKPAPQGTVQADAEVLAQPDDVHAPKPRKKGKSKPLLRAQIYPRLEIVRRPSRKEIEAGAQCFGPYPSAQAVYTTLRLINQHFKLRNCPDHVIDNRKRPCLQHQIGRCLAPCVYDLPEYSEQMHNVALFLSGKSRALEEQLTQRMWKLAEEERFEQAARVRDQLQSMQSLWGDSNQAVTDMVTQRDRDVFGTARRGSLFAVVHLPIREGRLRGASPFIFDKQEFPNTDLLFNFLSQFYHVTKPPQEIILPKHDVDFATHNDAIQLFLADLRSKQTIQNTQDTQDTQDAQDTQNVPTLRIVIPDEGEYSENSKLIEIACKNAALALDERLRQRETRQQALTRLQERLHLPRLPTVIECFDVSLWQGRDAVASQVCFVDGQPAKHRYRRYKIKTVEGTDDFAMMAEVLGRRIRRAQRYIDNEQPDDAMPDLLLIDGGKGQLGAVLKILRDHNVTVGADGVMVASIAKARTFDDVKTDASGRRNKNRPLTPRDDSLALVDGSQISQISNASPETKITSTHLKKSSSLEDLLETYDDDTESLSESLSGTSWGLDNPDDHSPSASKKTASPERIFLPGVKDPIALRQHTAERFLVEQIRDEAHRFAITYHRKLRSKRTLSSAVDDIAGVGPERRKELLRAFGSVVALRAAKPAQIAQAIGIGVKIAQRIWRALHPDPDENVG